MIQGNYTTIRVSITHRFYKKEKIDDIYKKDRT